MILHGQPISADVLADILAECGTEEPDEWNDSDNGDGDDHSRLCPWAGEL